MKKILSILFIGLFISVSHSAFSQPWQQLNPTALGSSAYLWQTGVIGDVGNYFYQNTWLERNGTPLNWTTATWVDGISIDASFDTPSTSRVWWRRNPYQGAHFWGSEGNTWMSLRQGRLAVIGLVHAQEVRVEATVSGPDYVFEKDYQLPNLQSVEKYISEHKHLPDVPSAAQMEKDGIVLGEMNMTLLKKIEELTLYVIEQQKQIEELKAKIK